MLDKYSSSKSLQLVFPTSMPWTVDAVYSESQARLKRGRGGILQYDQVAYSCSHLLNIYSLESLVLKPFTFSSHLLQVLISCPKGLLFLSNTITASRDSAGGLISCMLTWYRLIMLSFSFSCTPSQKDLLDSLKGRDLVMRRMKLCLTDGFACKLIRSIEFSRYDPVWTPLWRVWCGWNVLEWPRIYKSCFPSE